MNFNSPAFAVFLPIVLLLFGAIHANRRALSAENLMLVLASCVFYGWWDRRFLFLFMFSTWLDYFCGLAMLNRRPDATKCLVLFLCMVAGAFFLCAPIDWQSLAVAATGHSPGAAEPLQSVFAPDGSWRETAWALTGIGVITPLFLIGYTCFGGHPQRRYFLTLSIVTQLTLLGFFKYYDFFVNSLDEGLTHLGLDPTGWQLGIVVPVGISFYTFHTMSYTIDVYRGELEPTDSLVDFALFVSFFPQMIAGPIARARELLPQLQRRRVVSWPAFQCGTWLIFWGLFKKIFVADNLLRVVGEVYAPHPHPDPAGPDVLLATYAFAFQIYCDFSGYTDIARGVSRLFGVELLLNFNLPYTATNPRDFWRRWHISLSTWLRDYLYLSLGGNRGGMLFVYRNLMLTMILGGIWHGARSNFLWWGIYQGVLLCTHRLLEPLVRAVTPSGRAARNVFGFFCWLVFFHLVCYGWLLFRCQTNTQIGHLTTALASGWTGFPSRFGVVGRIGFYIAPLLAVEFFQWRTGNLLAPLNWPWPIRAGLYLILFYLAVLFGAFHVTEFIYFQF